MAKQPTHRAYLVPESEPDAAKKPHWTEVGAIWPHGKGEGFDLVLVPGLGVTGRLVCMPVTAKEEA